LAVCLSASLALALLLTPQASAAQVLKPLIVEAIASHPAAQSARQQQAAARAGLAGARWQYWPTPSVTVENAQVGSADSAYQGDSTVSVLRLQQPLWNGGRLAAGVERAEAGVGAGQAALDEVRLQLALRVVQGYGDWLGAHLKTLAHEKSLAVHEGLQARVQRRIAQGLSAESDGVLAVQRLQALGADLALSRSQQAIALSRLGQLIGHAPDVVALGVAQALPGPLSPDLGELLAQARAASPALQKAQAQTRVLTASLAERRAELAPEVYLRLERQFGNSSSHLSGGVNRVFIGLSSRLGAGLSNLTSIDAAQAQLEAAQADELTQARAVAEQVLADHALATSAEARLAALQGSLQSAAEVGQAYDRQFLAGRKSWLDVMNAARELTQTEVSLADALSAQMVVRWRLALNVRGLSSVLGDTPP
jgi:adhesin transport system outer membrane protein